MCTKFSEDVITLSELEVNPSKVINHTKDSRRPVLLTSRGRGVAVAQGLVEYEKYEEERFFVKAVVRGLVDINEGNFITVDEAKQRLGLGLKNSQ